MRFDLTEFYWNLSKDAKYMSEPLFEFCAKQELKSIGFDLKKEITWFRDVKTDHKILLQEPK